MFNENWSDEQKKAWRTQSRSLRDWWLDRVLYDPELTAGQKVTATVYARYFNIKERRAWPSFAAVAERISGKSETVRKNVKALCDRGYLLPVGHRIREDGSRGPNIYSLAVPHTEEDFDWLYDVKRKPRPVEDEEDEKGGHETDTPDQNWHNPPNGGGMRVPDPRDESTGPPVQGCRPPRDETTGNTREVLQGGKRGRDTKDLVNAHPSDERTNEDDETLKTISHFIALEREHRDEFINHWIDAAPRTDVFSPLDPDTSYAFILSKFRANMAHERRRDWTAAFKYFISNAVNDADPDRHGWAMGGGFMDLEELREQDDKIRDGRTWEEFRDAFPSPPQPVDDREYRRIWERLLLEVEAPVIWAALNEEQYVAGKFPREFEEKLLNTIRRTRGREKYRLMEKVSA